MARKVRTSRPKSGASNQIRHGRTGGVSFVRFTPTGKGTKRTSYNYKKR